MGHFIIEKFYLFFQGILLFQIIFFGVLYFITKRIDILYYTVYLFFTMLYFFVNAPYTFFNISEDVVFNSKWYLIVNTPLVIICNLWYIFFLDSFFNGLTNDKSLKKIFRFLYILIPVLLLIFGLLVTLNLSTELVFYIVNLLGIAPGTWIAFVILKKKLPYGSIVAKGVLCSLLGTLLSVIMIILGNYKVHHLFTDAFPLFFVRLGIVMDMIFFQIAILKKWHTQEKQLAVEKIQSQLNVEKLRNKISGELHDDIGSTLSGISMYSHLTQSMLENNNNIKAIESVAVIQKSTNEVIEKLGDLVWTVSPLNDSFSIILDKINEYGHVICKPKNIKFQFNSDWEMIQQKPTLEIRQHLYLLVKEAINNAVKYSNCGNLTLSFVKKEKQLVIKIEDDGVGMEIDKIKKGNGLLNMQNRAKELSAVLSIESVVEKGTSIILKIPQ